MTCPKASKYLFQRQLNAVKFSVSPDVKYVLLVSDIDEVGARYHVFEVQTRNQFPLSHKDGIQVAPQLQHVIWAPNPQAVTDRRLLRNQLHNKGTQTGPAPARQNEVVHSKRSGAPTEHQLSSSTGSVLTPPSNSSASSPSSPSAQTVDNNVISFSPKGQKYQLTGSSMSSSISQGIAFVHDNDVYYKPKVQSDLVCRITTTGIQLLI